MNARMATFLVCSLCLHLALLSLVGESAPFRAAVQGARSLRPALTVYLAASDRIVQRRASIESEKPNHPTKLPAPEEIKPSDMATPTVPLKHAAGVAAPAAQLTYVSPGMLTRLPAPITDIDLSTADVTESGFEGKLDLTILIDTDGNVVDVTTANGREFPSSFLEAVSARFKRARFSPGEVDGKAVNSQLRIMVVSERPAASSEHQ